MKSAPARIAVPAAALAVAALVLPDIARGGGYRVAICHPSLRARHADATFERTSRHYVSDASCAVGEDGLTVRHEGMRTRGGRWGGWTVRAPYGTIFSQVSVSAAGRRAGGHVPQLLATPLQGKIQAFGALDPGLEPSRLETPARSFAARLTCSLARGCREGRRARIRIKRLGLRLADHMSPTVALGGMAFRAGSRRGIQPVVPSATDAGGGIRRFLLQVNGEPVTAQATRCRMADGWALRLRPCPASVRAIFRVQTAASPFRQGQNLVRVCATDYASGTAANRDCTARRMHVDNLCPISRTGAGSRLEARLSRSGRRVHGRRAAVVRGRLRSPSGVPVAGARVCVATRVPIAGAEERVVTTPATGPDGHFAAELPEGPSRHVRVAYWWDSAHVAEHHLSLRVRARPRLKLRPRHAIRNGHRVRFKVRLRGPVAAHRWVRVQARAGRRWIELRNGRTNGRGVFRARYRFHATTGRRRYAFRAFVPSQHGYPYRSGHSRVGHVTVIG